MATTGASVVGGSIVAGFEAGLAKQTLLGVTRSGKTYTIANVIQRVQKPTLVMAPNKTLAAQLYGEFKQFFPHNAVEYFVSYYDYYQPEAYVPSTDTFIEKDSSVNEHIEQMRLSATKALLERRDAIIVCTVSAIYGLGDPNEYFKMVLHMVRGERIDQRELIRRLTEMQYTRNDTELRRGTYRVRGEVVDVHPAESDDEALRIELFDGEIEKAFPGFVASTSEGGPHYEAWVRFLGSIDPATGQPYEATITGAYGRHHIGGVSRVINDFLKDSGIARQAARNDAAQPAGSASGTGDRNPPQGDSKVYSRREAEAILKQSRDDFDRGRITRAQRNDVISKIQAAIDEGRVLN